MVTPGPGFWKGKRVLLTGHTGFKGSWCALWLEDMGAEVHGLALPPADERALWSSLGSPGGEASIGDVRDPAQVQDAFRRSRPHIVIHMAAQALVHPSYADPATTFDTNVMGLVRLLDTARATPGIRAIVNVTSDKCYENREQLWAYRETEPMGGADPYSASKGCAELVTASYRRSFFNGSDGPQIASARAGNVIGGGDWSMNRLVPDCIRSFASKAPVEVRNPLAVRPWQHVLEPVCGYLTLAQALYEQGAEAAEAWNFGPSDDDTWPVSRVVDRIVSLWGDGALWRRDEAAWSKEAMLLRVDAAKARARLGWRQRLPLEDALSWTVEWYKAASRGAGVAELSLDQIRRYQAIDS